MRRTARRNARDPARWSAAVWVRNPSTASWGVVRGEDEVPSRGHVLVVYRHPSSAYRPSILAISLFLDIGQGAGLAGASGVRPFLPPLLAGALARGDIGGVDFDDSGYDFLEEPGFLFAVFALAVVSYVAERSLANGSQGVAGSRVGEVARRSAPDGTGRPAAARDPVTAGLALAAVALGALLFAGSLAEGGAAGWPGLIAGAGCAALGYLAVATLFQRAGRRLDRTGTALLPVYADALALTLALAAVFVPPVSFAALAVFAWLTLRSRRGDAGKHAGLRILR